jgi:hypothetical protein
VEDRVRKLDFEGYTLKDIVTEDIVTEDIVGARLAGSHPTINWLIQSS